MRYDLYKIVPTILMIMLISCQTEAGEIKPECVILLHGLARTEKSFVKLERHLKKNGYHVVNKGYPSRKKKVQDLSVEAITSAVADCMAVNPGKIHFVTHSMGGILVRYYLEHHPLPELGRVVMLSPPNNGSEVVDKLKDNFIFKWLNGPAGRQLGTDADSLPKTLGPPDYEVGIIAGDKSVNLILSLIIPGKDDGKVSVENAKLEGMKDFLVVHKTHPFIMSDASVMRQVTSFIKNGRFDRDADRTN